MSVVVLGLDRSCIVKHFRSAFKWYSDVETLGKDLSQKVRTSKRTVVIAYTCCPGCGSRQNYENGFSDRAFVLSCRYYISITIATLDAGTCKLF